jgi:predicted DNA-binding transcriptional regulator AlpA
LIKAHIKSGCAEDAGIPWQQRPLLRLKLAEEITGLSSTSIYRLAHKKRLNLVRIAGRVLVETPSVIALISSAEAWTPSKRGEAGRKKSAELARGRWA